LLQRLAQEADEGMADTLYRDLKQGAQSQPACIPEALAGFAATALGKLLQDKVLLTKCLGEHLTEPKAHVWFEASQSTSQSDQALAQGCRLDRRTRMMYDAYHIYINGESYQVKGRDTTLLCRLANERGLSGRDVAQLSVSARSQLAQWLQAGWLVAMPS
jgi:50S ribosomal protein L16 3-hydroxylase